MNRLALRADSRGRCRRWPRWPRRARPAPARASSLRFLRRIVRYLSPGREVPVELEHLSERLRGGPADAEMGVPPGRLAADPAVLVADVDAAGEGDSPSTTTILRWLRRFIGWKRSSRAGRKNATSTPAARSARTQRRPIQNEPKPSRSSRTATPRPAAATSRSASQSARRRARPGSTRRERDASPRRWRRRSPRTWPRRRRAARWRCRAKARRRGARADAKELAIHRGRDARERVVLRRRECRCVTAALRQGLIGVALPLTGRRHAIAPEEQEQRGAEAREEEQRQDPRRGARGLLAAEDHQRDQRERDDLHHDPEPRSRRSGPLWSSTPRRSSLVFPFQLC